MPRICFSGTKYLINVLEVKETSKFSDFPAFHNLSDLMTTRNVSPIIERGS